MNYEMKKLLLCAALVLPTVALAASQGEMTDAYFPADEIQLTAQEKASLAIAKRFGSNTTSLAPVARPDGAIQFPYGSMRPTIVCGVLQVCDVELQASEKIFDLHLGDPRFNISPAITFIDGVEVQHLIIKPTDTGLDTSLVVITDRRVYTMRLRSHRTEYMPRIVFSYPDELRAKFEALQRRAETTKAESTIPETGEYLGALDFNYKLSGNAPWMPLRVYNDGQKTIIQVPTAITHAEAPVLMVLRGGGMFSSAEEVIPNYRLQGDRYVVDMVFDKAVLIAGVGNDQDAVTITRNK